MILTAEGLGKRFRQRWALADSLLNLAVGLLEPTAGSLAVLGARPGAQLAKVGFVAQDTPVNAALSAREHLRLGAKLNPGWDDALARDCLARIGLDPDERAGRLSGGQRAQLALTLGVAKRPEVLILDEPVASLDPLARRDFLAYLMEAVAEHGLSVILSSHLVSDLERVCDHLIVLVASRVKVAGNIDELLATHVRLTGPRRDTLPPGVVSARHTERQSTLMVRTEEPVLDPDWTVGELTLEDLVLAYMTPPVERRRALEAVR